MTEMVNTHLKEILHTANRTFEHKFEQAQFKLLAELYTQDGIVLPPNMGMIKGHEAIAGLWQAVSSMGIQSVKLETVEVEECDRLAIEVGLFELYGEDRQLLDQGKYIVIWKHAEGEWKLHRDIFNSSLPVQK